MKSFLKIKKEAVFWIVAGALFFLALIYAFIAIRFAAVSLKDALYEDLSSAPAVTRFDFEKLDQVLSGRFGTSAPR